MYWVVVRSSTVLRIVFRSMESYFAVYFFQTTLFESLAKGPHARSNGKWTSNGTCSTSHNQFLQAHFLKIAFISVPFETSGTALCGTTGLVG